MALRFDIDYWWYISPMPYQLSLIFIFRYFHASFSPSPLRVTRYWFSAVHFPSLDTDAYFHYFRFSFFTLLRYFFSSFDWLFIFLFDFFFISSFLHFDVFFFAYWLLLLLFAFFLSLFSLLMLFIFIYYCFLHIADYLIAFIISATLFIFISYASDAAIIDFCHWAIYCHYFRLFAICHYSSDTAFATLLSLMPLLNSHRNASEYAHINNAD